MNHLTMTEVSNSMPKTSIQRISTEDIDAAIADEYYFTAEEGAIGGCAESRKKQRIIDTRLSDMSFCVLILQNGLLVTGESSHIGVGSVRKEFNRRLARNMAVEKLKVLLNYGLCDEHHDKSMY